MACKAFTNKRNCLFGKISSIDSHFLSISDQQKFVTLMCPSNVKIAKLTNRFISIAFEARKRIDRGENIDRGQFTEFQLNDSAFSGYSSDT